MSILDDEITLVNNDSGILDECAKKLMLNYPINEPGKDAYGNELHEDDYVLYISSNIDITGSVLRIGKIKKICKKLISVVSVKNMPKWGKNTDGQETYEETYHVRCDKILKIDIKDFIK